MLMNGLSTKIKRLPAIMLCVSLNISPWLIISSANSGLNQAEVILANFDVSQTTDKHLREFKIALYYKNVINVRGFVSLARILHRLHGWKIKKLSCFVNLRLFELFLNFVRRITDTSIFTVQSVMSKKY